MPGSLPQFERIEIPVRIGLVADTHRHSGSPIGLPLPLIRGLDGCELIMHAGDFNSSAVFDELRQIAPVVGVHGNNDELDIVRALPDRRYLLAGEKRIGLIHAHQRGRNAREAAMTAMDVDLDCVVYGHSHMPDFSCENGLLLVNPGSPTQRRRAPSRSFAIMAIDEASEIKVEFFSLD